MTSGSLKMTLAELEKKITYPPKLKKHGKLEPLATPESSRLLQEYHSSMKVKKTEMSRFKMSSTTASNTLGNSKDATSSISLFLEDGHKALEKGNVQEALSYYLESVRMGNNTAEIYNTIADLYSGKKMYAEAIDFYTRSLTVNPLRSEMYLRRGDCYLNVQNYALSVQEYLKYMKLEEPTQDILVRACKVALDADRIDIGAELLDTALLRFPNDAYVQYLKGDVEERAGNLDVSRKFFARVMELDPDFPQPYIEQAEKHFAEGEFVASLNVFQAVLKLLPTDATIYARIADVYDELGSEYTPNRLACLTSALEYGLSPEAAQSTYVRRATVYLRDYGQLADAISDLTLCIEINPKNDVARELRAEGFALRNGVGDTTAAVEDYEIFVSLPGVQGSRKARPYIYLAEHYYVIGEHVRAAHCYAYGVFNGYPADKIDAFKISTCCAKQFLQTAESNTWYELKPITDPVGGGKVDAKKAPTVVIPVPPLQFRLIDATYGSLKDEEPTVHNTLELEFVSAWNSYHDTIEKKKEEFEELRAGGKKGGAAKKK